jgi:hypothetical protein
LVKVLLKMILLLPKKQMALFISALTSTAINIVASINATCNGIIAC